MSKSKDENLLTPLVEAVQQSWRHRPELKFGKWTIFEDQRIPAAVLDTIDALHMETRSGLKPVLSVKPVKTDYGYRLIFNLPPGISCRDFENKINYFEEQTNGSIELTSKGPTLFMDIYAGEMQTNIPYSWEPLLYPNMALPMPVGVMYNGKLLAVDLSKMPHCFIAGNTGMGKTTQLFAIANSLLATNRIRQNIALIVIDLKRVDFSYLSNHAIVCDTEQLACEALTFLNRELDRRLLKLKEAGAKNLHQYKGQGMSWIVLIIDELAELTDKKAQEDLNRLSRLARAPGISIIGATQRPSATMYKNFSDTRAMFQARMCFSVAGRHDSEIALGNDAADKLAKNIPGRAIFQWDGQTTVQAMYLSDAEAEKLLGSTPAAKGVNWGEQRSKRLLPR